MTEEEFEKAREEIRKNCRFTRISSIIAIILSISSITLSLIKIISVALK